MSILKLLPVIAQQVPVIINTDFIFKWETTTPAETMVFPLKSGGSYNITIDWGDGSSSDITSDSDPDASHEYADAGEYTVTIPSVGTCSALYFWYSATGDKVTEISQFGGRVFTDLDGAFGGLSLCDFTALDTLDISAVTTLNQTFGDCQIDLPDVSGWDTSLITDLNDLFTGCKLSNPDVSLWDVGNVTDMQGTFKSCPIINPDVSLWDTSKVTTMKWMFLGSPIANPDVSSWDTGACTSFDSMFGGAGGNAVCNPDVSSWDTALVTRTRFMFHNCTAANPDCSSWNPASLVTCDSMFAGCAISDANYSALLIAWEAHASTPSNISLTNTPASYTAGAAAAARASLIGTYGWTISDGGAA